MSSNPDEEEHLGHNPFLEHGVGSGTVSLKQSKGNPRDSIKGNHV